MSHFVINVIIPKEVFDIDNPQSVEDFITSQLEKYDEQKETPRYLKYTRQQLIEKNKEEVEDYKNSVYAVYLKDPEEYKSKCRSNQGHIDYIEKEFPQKLNFTDEQHYQDAIKFYEDTEIGTDGEVYSEYNPNSKWDWYVIGGRWAGWLQNREKELETDNGFNFKTPRTIKDNFCKVSEAIEKKLIPFAIVTPDGSWNERGEMGWFGIVTQENDDWDKAAIEIYGNFKDDFVVSVDCHI